MKNHLEAVTADSCKGARPKRSESLKQSRPSLMNVEDTGSPGEKSNLKILTGNINFLTTRL